MNVIESSKKNPNILVTVRYDTSQLQSSLDKFNPTAKICWLRFGLASMKIDLRCAWKFDLKIDNLRIRPPSEFEKGNKNSSLSVKCMDERVVIFDPADLNKPQQKGPQGIRRGKDIQFAFDRVFDQYASQYEVFQHTTQQLVNEVLNGYNCSCFAYGATGAGKTFTMVGNADTPGVMVLTLQELFSAMKATEEEKKYQVKISYLEIYNENIRDLLVPNSKPLALLENGGEMTVVGLTQHEPKSAEEVLVVLQEGNTRRAQNFTHANAESSRSHAVLQVVVEQRDRTANVTTGVRTGKFSLIDLAGSERASRTKNMGAQLKEGANINRSLLALGNCINALGEGYTEGKYVPYRDSKLTRLLKDSLGGNCKTVMISNVSPSTLSYEDTFNTLQYANRAKNIKTKVRANEINLEVHVSEYKDLIADLRAEVETWKKKCVAYEKTIEESSRIMEEQEENQHENASSSFASQSVFSGKPNFRIPNSASRPNNASTSSISRTVSFGLATPRNSKVDKRLLNISAEVDDAIIDRRNTQRNLETVNTAMKTLQSSKSQMVLSLSSTSIESTVTVDGFSNTDLFELQKREIQNLELKIEEQALLKNTLLQRLSRNAETTKRLQVEISQIVPHAEDAVLYRQLKLELQINSLEIQNFYSNMQNTQLTHIIQTCSERTQQSTSLLTYYRIVLLENDWEEPQDVTLRFNELSLLNGENDGVLSLFQKESQTVQLPSPFHMKSPRGGSIMDAPYTPLVDRFGVPSTPSRFDSTGGDNSSFNTVSSPMQSNYHQRQQPRQNQATASASKSRLPLSSRKPDALSVSKPSQLNPASNTKASVSRIGASTTSGTSRPSTSSAAPPSSKKPVTVASKPIRIVSVTSATNSTVSTSSAAVTKLAATGTRTDGNQNNYNAPPAATMSNASRVSTNQTALKKSSMGPAIRGPTKPAATTGTAKPTSNSTANNKDPQYSTPVKASQKYRDPSIDSKVEKALATFKPSFVPRSTNSPASANKASTSSKSTKTPKGTSESASKPKNSTTDEILSSNVVKSSSFIEPNPLVAMLTSDAKFHRPSSSLDILLQPSAKSSTLSSGWISGTSLSKMTPPPNSFDSPSISSPLVSFPSSSSYSPVSPLSKPMRV